MKPQDLDQEILKHRAALHSIDGQRTSISDKLEKLMFMRDVLAQAEQAKEGDSEQPEA